MTKNQPIVVKNASTVECTALSLGKYDCVTRGDVYQRAEVERIYMKDGVVSTRSGAADDPVSVQGNKLSFYLNRDVAKCTIGENIITCKRDK